MIRLGAIIAMLSGALLIVGSRSPQSPGSFDAVATAFDTYEQLWRDAAVKAADGLESGELSSDTETREFLSAANQAARKTAFQPIAKAEDAALQDWSAEAHAKLLREYAR